MLSLGIAVVLPVFVGRPDAWRDLIWYGNIYVYTDAALIVGAPLLALALLWLTKRFWVTAVTLPTVQRCAWELLSRRYDEDEGRSRIAACFYLAYLAFAYARCIQGWRLDRTSRTQRVR